MNSPVVALGSIILLVGLVMLATGVPAVAIVGILVLLCAFIIIVVGAAASAPKPIPSATPEVDEKLQAEPTAIEQPSPQPVTKEIYREREIIREIVKIRCRHCGSVFEEKLNCCPNCGAPP